MISHEREESDEVIQKRIHKEMTELFAAHNKRERLKQQNNPKAEPPLPVPIDNSSVEL